MQRQKMPSPKKATAREPLPTLFIHPSTTAPHVSLSGNAPYGASAAAGSWAGTRQVATTNSPDVTPGNSTAIITPADASRRAAAQANRNGDASRPKIDRTDALWAQMQATLEEVSDAGSRVSRIFGPDHDRKLSDLRAAQIALAQAWARSAAEEAIETAGEKASFGDVRSLRAQGVGSETTKPDTGAGTDGVTKSASIGTESTRPGSSGKGGAGVENSSAKMEEETELDILLVRKRREANDCYFQRVNLGVLDVVAKLDDVAVTMRAVEKEGKGIWVNCSPEP